jgi:Zn-finger nucleic acid-binding protein
MINNLVQTRKARISYDTCEDCGSLWLDAGELDKMAFQVDGSIEVCSKDKVENAPGEGKDCPRCDDVTLDKVSFIGSDLVLDRCANCEGFWLDGGELGLVSKELLNIMPVKGKGFSEFVNNVHVPYWYKRVRKTSSETDFKVDVMPIKGAELKSQTEHVCPTCQANLSMYTVFGIEFEGCSTCKGVLLDRDELRKLKDNATRGTWRTLRWMDDEVEAVGRANTMPSGRTCAKCSGAHLVATSFGDSKILIDWCAKCNSVWLDRDELEGIIEYLREKLDELPSDEMKKNVLEEIKEIWTGPESRISEILDAKAAISALINITIFEHPSLCQRLILFSETMPIR